MSNIVHTFGIQRKKDAFLVIFRYFWGKPSNTSLSTLCCFVHLLRFTESSRSIKDSPFNSLGVALWQMALSVYIWKLYGDVNMRRWSAQPGGADHPHRSASLQVYNILSSVLHLLIITAQKVAATKDVLVLQEGKNLMLAYDVNTGDFTNKMHIVLKTAFSAQNYVKRLIWLFKKRNNSTEHKMP